MSYFPRLCATFMNTEKFKFVLLNMDVTFLKGDMEYYGSLIKHTHTNTHNFSDYFKDTKRGLTEE